MRDLGVSTFAPEETFLCLVSVWLDVGPVDNAGPWLVASSAAAGSRPLLMHVFDQRWHKCWAEMAFQH